MAHDPFDDEFFRRLWRMLKGFDREFREMERKFKIELREFERRPGVAGFKVEIRDHGEGKPEVKVTPIGRRLMRIAPAEAPVEVPVEKPKPPKVERRKIKPVTRMLETNCGKVERLDEVVLTMQTPGVKKKDVEIRQLGNTLEVIARKPSGEAYFGAFELPPYAAPGEREVELKGELLIISIPRRRRYPRMRPN
ncbi:MAG: Hsp20/alpha crystallin family protein [Hadesarchaea archaeon]|nr:Hsp20/alpha crystallin family protein [Hadesarchaea archaeon]